LVRISLNSSVRESGPSWPGGALGSPSAATGRDSGACAPLPVRRPREPVPAGPARPRGLGARSGPCWFAGSRLRELLTITLYISSYIGAGSRGVIFRRENLRKSPALATPDFVARSDMIRPRVAHRRDFPSRKSCDFNPGGHGVRHGRSPVTTGSGPVLHGLGYLRGYSRLFGVALERVSCDYLCGFLASAFLINIIRLRSNRCRSQSTLRNANANGS
jgi:hypothetical protein